ncbi:MAG: glycosyltransferase [Rubrobacter sp.]|nr:glycosyltransferase [Rubrobacter sp.]
MRFSLILATVDRVEEPRRFLASLDSQTFRDFELIVVDQNPDDRMDAILDPYTGRFPVLHLRSEARGLSRARNLGLKHASGDAIAFPDDDCEYPPGLLENVGRFLDENPHKDGLTGRSVDSDGNTSNSKFDAESGALNEVNVWMRAIEYAVFLRAKVMGGTWFDESLGVGAGTPWGACEGTDYLIRLLRKGASLHYDPNLEVAHPQLPMAQDAETARKAYAYGCGMGRVLKKSNAPLWLKARYLARPLVAIALYSVRLDFPASRWYWEAFKGRLRGLIP